MQSLRALINRDELVVAPLVLNPIMARLARDCGFKAGYISGGSLGWQQCVTEANITLPEMAQVALDMRATCDLPLVLDAGGGWGDPVHMHRTMALSEAAGFAAIEVEDQFLPRRVHHHIGVERLIEPQQMVQKIRELVAARRNPDTLIIGRTNALRLTGMDDALRRAEAMKKAGADMLFVWGRKPEDMRHIAERLPAPLMTFAPPDGFSTFPISKAELVKMGYRLMASSGSAFAAMVKAVRGSYEALAQDRPDDFMGPGGVERWMKEAHKVTGLERMLEIERRTMKGG